MNAPTNPYRQKIVEGYRERLLKALLADDIFAMLRDAGRADLKNASAGRDWLLANWSNHIRYSAMDIVTRNLELDSHL